VYNYVQRGSVRGGSGVRSQSQFSVSVSGLDAGDAGGIG
jgi:hypothetical protein